MTLKWTPRIRNLANNLTFGLLTLLICVRAFATNISPIENVKLDAVFWSAFGKAPDERHVKVFKNQSFFIKDLDVIFFAGEVTKTALPPIKKDCFIYLKNETGEARIFFTSRKANRLWSCVGQPALVAMSLKNAQTKLAILSMFLYQAPSGEFFNLPLILQADKKNNFSVGPIDRCVDEKIKYVDLKKITQLYKPTKECAANEASNNHEHHYEGRRIIEGRYGIDEGGELYFLPSPRSEKKLPGYEKSHSNNLGFRNEDYAVKVLNLSGHLKELDLKKYCGLLGDARIVVSNFMTGEGASHAWYTVSFDSAIMVKKPSLVLCKSN